MSQSPAPVAGPSSQTARSDLYPQAVVEYLQQHGFDKAVATFEQELKGRAAGDGNEKDGDGDEEAKDGTNGTERTTNQGGREAIFRAPDPISLDHMVKRNIPQATTMSASTMSDRITPEFIAQAQHIVEQLTLKVEGATAAANGDTSVALTGFIDSSDRIEGYKRYRRWVDDGLELWKPELDSLCFPIFANIFIDMIEAGFKKAGKSSQRAIGHLINHSLKRNNSSKTILDTTRMLIPMRSQLYRLSTLIIKSSPTLLLIDYGEC